MAINSYKWLRRSKKKFQSSEEAWEDIMKTSNYTKRSVKVMHTNYYWRWKVTRLNTNFR